MLWRGLQMEVDFPNLSNKYVPLYQTVCLGCSNLLNSVTSPLILSPFASEQIASDVSKPGASTQRGGIPGQMGHKEKTAMPKRCRNGKWEHGVFESRQISCKGHQRQAQKLK